MSAPWTGTSAPAASSAATFTIAAPVTTGTGLTVRCTSMSASVIGSGNATFQVSDGSTVLHSILLAGATASSAQTFQQNCVDYRASASNSLTIGFLSGVSGMTQTVNGQGDFVQVGAEAKIIPTR